MELEFNSDQTWIQRLDNLKIFIPYAGSRDPTEKDFENSTFAYNSAERRIEWTIAQLDKNESEASLTFEYQDELEESEFFPLNAEFELPKTQISINILEVLDAITNEPLKYEHKQKLTTESFTITN